MKIKSDFRSQINNYRASRQKDASTEDYCSVLNGPSKKAADKSC